MRIGVNTRVLLKGRMEGVARYIHETVSRMALTHPQDQFYLFFDRPYHQDFVYAENVIPVVIGPQARHPLLWYIWFEWSLKRALIKHKIDVFLSPDTYMSLSTNVPTLLVTHDLAYLHYPNHIPKSALSYYRKYFPQNHDQAKAIIAVSEFTKSDIISAYNIEPSKITVGYNAVSDSFKQLPIQKREEIKEKYTSGNPFFIYVGSLHPRKNITRLIQAFNKFKETDDQNYKLLLVGRKAWKNVNIDQALKFSKFKDQILHLDSVKEELPSILGSADALVYVSLFEGFGIPLLEAMACGVPVVTSKVSSMKEVAGDATILVDPTNLNEITHAMNSIAKEESLRGELTQKGLQRMQAFSWDNTSNIIYDKLKEIVS